MLRQLIFLALKINSRMLNANPLAPFKWLLRSKRILSSCSNPRALGCGEFQILLCSHPFILPAMSSAMILVKRYQEKAFSKAYLR